MRILIITALMALPLMALGQTAEQQQTTTQGQTKETQTTAPAKGKKMRPEQEQNKPQAKPETGTTVRGEANVKSGTPETKKNEPGARSSTSQTKVNVQEFKARHSEVFSLGRHPKEFFVERFGANHVRLIGNTYFVFVDNCWVAVDVDGFVYTERLICAGDPDFIEVD
jgi:hypothetical protein